MNTSLEFRGRWLQLFGNLLLIGLLTSITLGLYAPWGYARWRRIITENTYYNDQPLMFDGTGAQAFVEFLIIGFFSIITLGLYYILGFAGVRLLRWQYSHTAMPTGQRLEYEGGAIDLFFEYFLLSLFSGLTLGIYYFWGYTRIRRHIVTNTYLDGQPLQFTGSGIGFLGITLLNLLLTVVTLGFWAILTFAMQRQLRWDIGNTLVPSPLRAGGPMPVHSHTLTPMSAELPEIQRQPRSPQRSAPIPPSGEETLYRRSQEDDRT